MCQRRNPSHKLCSLSPCTLRFLLAVHHAGDLDPWWLLARDGHSHKRKQPRREWITVGLATDVNKRRPRAKSECIILSRSFIVANTMDPKGAWWVVLRNGARHTRRFTKRRVGSDYSSAPARPGHLCSTAPGLLQAHYTKCLPCQGRSEGSSQGAPGSLANVLGGHA